MVNPHHHDSDDFPPNPPSDDKKNKAATPKAINIAANANAFQYFFCVLIDTAANTIEPIKIRMEPSIGSKVPMINNTTPIRKKIAFQSVVETGILFLVC